ncbi:hypothetical protein EKL30_15745 [Candidimonas sp. SYP-B2681]|uniref:hypothetical protein n=1 Tax=Candidimonas sp. SYP-B2681 TaxID=2497686 RepID=UPI000F86BB1E|nr:hypothetical protein [Candidimonas sp. SYP-B2681]RTZ41131.1 hypothetical protein EKL30_15745 [Candidimonas sp. SYP-B2681]
MKTHPGTDVGSVVTYSRVSDLLKFLLPMLVLCASDAPLARAAHKVEERLAAIATKQFDWDAQQAIKLSGVPVYLKPFSSKLSPIQTAQTLAAHSDLFQRVHTAQNKIVLAGLQPEWHWLAEIEPAEHGAAGYVSALYVDAGRLGPGKQIDLSEFEWLPSHAKKQFSQQTADNSQTITQQVYSVSMARGQLSDYIAQQLTHLGWTKDLAVTDISDASAWRRKGARLMLFPQESALGTSLLVHFVE